MFKVNQRYANRKGNYVVRSIDGKKMEVEYDDGTIASLNMAIQYRIWENIEAERLAAEAKRSQRKRRSVHSENTRFYIKTMLVSDEPDLAIPGLSQRIAAAAEGVALNQGDRLIYFAIEPQSFFAVTTITGDPRKGKAKDYLFGDDESAIQLFPIDVDAQITSVRHAVSAEGVELESLPNFKSALMQPSTFHLINEDDFELLAELVAEVDEEEQDEDADSETLLDEVDADDLLRSL